MSDSYYSNDRTFCANSNCKETECEMNQSHIRFPVREISLADYSVTGMCGKLIPEYVVTVVSKAGE